MIRFKLAEVLKERNLTMYQLGKLTGIRPNTISQWVHDDELQDEGKGVRSITRETLEVFCEALECDVQDLIEYVPEEQ
ncbi:helix-turn-helix domain-containing protein [Shouchella shacheensis]|uniref:helix-turn-helix domain-containing protein n=1 Tax=Shouchella shacheensis TaxID=1649580 RepID=UPI0007403930|nr:helix-turn-helix transcriptional regulator [Shouchella shacheensis]